MKNLLLIAIAILGFSAVSFGQADNATATASATIITPIAITNNGDLNFGNIVATGAGIVTIATNSSPSYPDAAVIAYAVPGNISAAHFNVVGSTDASFTISPIAAITVANAAGDVMTVDGFTTDPALTAGKLSNLGTQTINVGATLHVTATHPAGFYTSTTPFTVTVNYN